MKFILSDKVFLGMIAAILIVMAVVTCVREGKDLKVGLFGVTKVLQKESPYYNPTDANRPIFRYAPGFAILQAPFLLTSKMTAPFKFEHIIPSVLSWYLASVIALLGSILIIFKLIPAASSKISSHNLKLSIILALPLIAYELSNSQNKIIALFFILAAIYMFERNRNFLSAIFLSLAVTVYIPLIFFSAYFVFRSRGRYILPLLFAGAVIFLLIPSMVLGIGYNNFLLADWYTRCLKPFLTTRTYDTYMDLRSSSQSLPSAIGRIFVWGRRTPYQYIIPPAMVHIIIRVFLASMFLVSLATVLKRVKPRLIGLSYAVFLPLGLIMPSYCIWYTWAWIFVLSFCVLNHVSYPDVKKGEKNFLIASLAVLIVTSYSIAIAPLNDISIMAWGTIFYWASVSAILLKNEWMRA